MCNELLSVLPIHRNARSNLPLYPGEAGSIFKPVSPIRFMINNLHEIVRISNEVIDPLRFDNNLNLKSLLKLMNNTAIT